MVVFTCNTCGESVKKTAVEKHYMTKCRNCEVLSCMDCGKDFHGDAYKEHTQCVSENEKYGGKDYKAPANSNKGEVKQQQWLQRLHQEAKEASKLNPQVAGLLNRVAEYPNVPRKKAKFENFMSNSLRVSNKLLIGQVWDIFNEAGKKVFESAKKEKLDNQNATESTVQSQDNDSKTDQSGDAASEPSENTDQSHEPKKKKKKKKDKLADVETETVESNDSKPDKKRKRRQEDPEFDIPAGEDSDKDDVKKTKKKKKKHQDDDDDEQSQKSHTSQTNGHESKKKKKSRRNEETNGKRKRNFKDEDVESTSGKMAKLDDSSVDSGEEEEQVVNTKKFKWEKVILSILQTCPDKELPLKKLRKKVLNEYHSCGGDVRIKSMEDLRAMFEKKVNKNPHFKVHKEVVKLVKS